MNASSIDSPRRTGTYAAQCSAASAGWLRGAAVWAGTRKGYRMPALCRLARGGFPALGHFVQARRGVVAVESALAIAALVVVLGGLMAIAHAAYSDDRMSRAARAAARAVALVTDTSATQSVLESTACVAIRTELDRASDFDCKAEWGDGYRVKADLKPSTLEAGTNGSGDAGDMVLVEIEWLPARWTKVVFELDESNPWIATGVARREPADPGG